MPLVELKNSDELEAWLRKQSHEVLVAFVARAALRVLPVSGKLFIIKIDIEGFEKDLFSSETSWLSEATVVIIELHDWMLPGQYNSLPFQKAMLPVNSEVLISGENLIFVR
jgi:hypothetical protein